MKWVLFAALGLGALVAIVAVVGAMLPRDHSATVRAVVPRALQQLWPQIRDIETWPTWNPLGTRVERMADLSGHPQWMIESAHGKIPYEIVEATETNGGARLVTRISDPKLPYGGIWTWELKPQGESCEVVITETGFVTNPIFRFMSRFVFGHTANLEAVIAALQK